MMIQSKTNSHLSIINSHLAFCPLHLSRTLYKSTLFMQNKPNFRKSQMNVNIFLTKAYENKSNWTLGENKPNSNPIKPNLQNAKMNVNLYVIEDYRKKDDFIVRINKPNLQNAKNERKLNFNKGLQKKRCFRIPKNKPKTNPILSAVGGFRKAKIACQKIWPHPLLTHSGNCLTSSYFTNIIHKLLIRLLLCRTFK